MNGRATSPSSWSAVVAGVARRPRLWSTALRQAARFRRRRWWMRRPFLPVPDPALLRFRMVTAYGGDGSGTPAAHDVIAWLEWCRGQGSRPLGPTNDVRHNAPDSSSAHD